MRIWGILLIVLLLATEPVNAQSRKNNQKDRADHGLNKKGSLNKSWLDLSNGTLPKFSFGIAAQGGFLDISTEETNVELIQPFGIYAPSLFVNINPSDVMGLHFGINYRETDVFYRSFNDFENNNLRYVANGSWLHEMSSVGLNFGITFFGNVSRRSTSCKGFRLSKGGEYTHFMLQLGGMVGRTIVDQLEFTGDYRIVQGGEVIEGEQGYSGVMIPDGRRINSQNYIYAKPGFRFQTGNYATRLSGFVEMQFGDNTGLVNDFSPHTFSFLVYGIQLGIEFF